MFQGFVPPIRNYFPMPNEWINICAEIDNLAELKVIQYVLRHTWGYREYGILKMISTDEFMYGRKRHDGTRLDNGTGLSKQSVIDGIRRAVEDGFLVCETDDSDRARVKKAYKLKMTGDDDSCEPDVQDLDPDVNDLDTGVQEVDSQNGCQDSRQQMSRKQTADVNDLDSSCPGSRQRSEKNTREKTFRKTPEKNNNSPRVVVPEQILCLGATAPSLSVCIEKNKETDKDERPATLTIHPEHNFVLLDDLIRPSLMSVKLTHAFPHRFYSEVEDKRRERIANELMRQFESCGLMVEIEWQHETGEDAVVESASPPSAPETEPAATEVKPLDDKQIIEEWRVCQEKPIRISGTMRLHAVTLQAEAMMPGEISRCRDWLIEHDKKGWIKAKGGCPDIGDIVNGLKRFRKATAAQPTVQEIFTEAPASNPDDPYNQTSPGMTKETCDFVVSEIRKHDSRIIISVDEDHSLCYIGIQVGQGWIPIDNYRGWCHLDQSWVDKAISYGEYIYNKKLQQESEKTQ